ncbi:asparagine synthase-related protein [Streptomyces sp. NPDC059740]|uniref:asparagine synthase-related protein n=1 Tax=Streptomyces sp. NPDC059740 TaxID=3346926 RepID=UPI00364673F1
MRWLVGWSSAPGGSGTADGSPHPAVQPVGAYPLWEHPDPLWAVGDWRPDEVRQVQVAPDVRLAVFGLCGASDDQLRVGLLAARGGAFRHLTAWPGSYTAVAVIGRRITVTGDLAGLRPVFHTPWAGGTAFATAALPLADLVEATLDVDHLAAVLACPASPEAVGDGTPYAGVHRVPPGHALVLRGGTRDVTSYEPTASLAVAAPQTSPEQAVAGVRDALLESVRVRFAEPRHAPPPNGHDPADLYDGSAYGPHPGAPGRDPGPVPGMGPADRRAARGAPAAGIGADLSGGSASGTLALLAAGLPGAPGSLDGDGRRLLAVTFNDLATPAGRGHREAELERARVLASDPRMRHVVVTAGEEALPFADLGEGPLTDEPGPSLVTAARHRTRLLAGSADHLVGLGARQVMDAHPARLADLLLDRRRRHLLHPVTALARSEGSGPQSVLVPFTVYRAARKLARTSHRSGVAAAAELLRSGSLPVPPVDGDSAVDASLAALSWCRPGPAARWLTGEALAVVAFRLGDAVVRGTAGAQGLTAARPGEQLARAALARHAADVRVLTQAAELRDQRLHTPFLDNQVVQACRALPDTVRVRPGARASTLRTVLAGAGVRHLPDGWGAPSHVPRTLAERAGLRLAAPVLAALFDAPLLADAGLVDARAVRRALTAAAQGERVPPEGLAEVVAVEVWLRRLLARRGTCWTESGTDTPRRRALAGGIPALAGPVGGG